MLYGNIFQIDGVISSSCVRQNMHAATHEHAAVLHMLRPLRVCTDLPISLGYTMRR